MTNLLEETVSMLEGNGKSQSDVLFVSLKDKSNNESAWFSWDEFSILANFNYRSGFGEEEINDTLMVVGEDFWLERHEYDGSEWWEFKKLPDLPRNRKVPVKNDLLCVGEEEC